MKKNILLGLNVIITRPKHQTKALRQLILEKGANGVIFPAIEIIKFNIDVISSLIDSIYDLDLAIFTSQNAVAAAASLIPKPPPFKVAAIGPSTAKALNSIGIEVDIVPFKGFDSEHLLATSIFDQIENKKLVIFTGEGGRDWLEKQLSSKGAKVLKAALYRRQCPDVSPDDIKKIVSLNNRIILVTSGESLENLVKMFAKDSEKEWLKQSHLLVISQRIKEIALRAGFEESLIIRSENATDQAILESLIKWYPCRHNKE